MRLRVPSRRRESFHRMTRIEGHSYTLGVHPAQTRRTGEPHPRADEAPARRTGLTRPSRAL